MCWGTDQIFAWAKQKCVGWAAVPMHGTGTDANEVLRGMLPNGAAGRWCAVRVRGPASGGWWARLELTDEARGQVVRAQFLAAARPGGAGWVRETLVHVPGGAVGLGLRIFSADGARVSVALAVLPRWRAALALLWRGRKLIVPALKGNSLGLAGRLRAMLGQAPARAGDVPPYAAWIALCEARLPAPPAAPVLDVQAVILPQDGGAAAIDASLASLTTQTLQTPRAPRVVRDPIDWAACQADWLVVLGAGEVLAPEALAWWAHAIALFPAASCVFGDFDALAADGRRSGPVFLPAPDALLLRSGLPTRGPCMVRRPASLPDMPGDATAVRGVLAAQRSEPLVHVPRILAHCPANTVTAPVGVVMPAVTPVDTEDFAPRVVALVPSAARSVHVARCVRALVLATSYQRLWVDVLLAAPAAASDAVVRQLRTIPRVRVREVPRAAFNYAAVNNAGAAGVDEELLLLVNDDVAPLAPEWLHAMVRQMRDPRVGIVGARLLYGNGLVQHEGVIMGLADLCEHAGRLRPAEQGGAHAMGRITRQVSAVTGACMLIRSKLYHDLGGMDEGFAVALNDVDFCLRVRQAGWRIVYCAEAELYHFESLSLGRHYGGARAGLEKLEVLRLRQRWAAEIEDDPFYNPLAALEAGREWQPAFPPRCGAVVPRAANPAAVA